jgi:hypothetical protein
MNGLEVERPAAAAEATADDGWKWLMGDED